MTGNSEPTYRVDRLHKVDLQIQELAQRFGVQRISVYFLENLQTIIRMLETQPKEWGDPVYNTKVKGGTVFRGIRKPLIVQYAVYEPQRVVIIFDIKSFE